MTPRLLAPEHLSLLWPVPGCLREHIHQTTILNKNLRPWAQVKISVFYFLSLPDVLSVPALSTLSINYFLVFDYYSAHSKDPLGWSWGTFSWPACIKFFLLLHLIILTLKDISFGVRYSWTWILVLAHSSYATLEKLFNLPEPWIIHSIKYLYLLTSLIWGLNNTILGT